MLNPKLTIFFFAFLPAVRLGERGPAARGCWLLSVVFMLVTFVVFALYGWAAAAHAAAGARAAARGAVAAPRRSPATYVALAGRLAVEGR